MGKTTDKEVVEIKQLDIQRLPIRIVGDSPLIVHAWSEKAKRMMLEAQQKTTKTKAREIRRPFMDFVDSMYWLTPKPEADTDDELEKKYREIMMQGSARFGFPVTAVKQAANISAVRNGWVKYKTGLNAAYFLSGNYGDYFEIKYEELTRREDMVRVGMGTADLRYRAQFSGWSADLMLTYNASSNITIEQILTCINAGGFSIGIGEWRPDKDGSFGMFHVEAAQ